MSAKLRPVSIIMRREIRDQLRDWRILVPIVLLTALFPGILNFAGKEMTNFLISYGADVIGQRLIPFLIMLVGFFPMTISLVIALESFVGEKERRSIEPLLNLPVDDWQLYLGKMLASLVAPLASSYLGILVYLVGVGSESGFRPAPMLLVQIVGLTTVQAVTMVAGAVVISTQTTSVRAANLFSSFIVIPMGLLIQVESIIIFWGLLDILWWIMLGQLIIAGMLVRMGVSYFNREELLGRELDTLNFRWAWRIFRTAFTGEARTLKDWFAREIPLTLRRQALPVGLMALLFVAGGVLGASQSDLLPLPPGTFSQQEIYTQFAAGIDQMPFFQVSTVPALWLHNLRALALATLLGIFSFGVGGILTIMLPMFIIGFMAGSAAAGGFSPWLFLTAFILPHGVLEIPALVLMGGAIMRLGATLTSPARGKTIGEAWLVALADWAKVFICLAAPLLIGSAVLEVMVTPRVALMVLGGG